LRCPGVTAINLGRGSLHRLGATYPWTQRAASMSTYLVLLRAEIARFTLVASGDQGGYEAAGWRP